MYTIKEIMQFVAENDVKFIRLSFCDKAGDLKNLCVMAGNLEQIFNEGQTFDASPLFEGEKRLRLVPDPLTLMAMPWRPSQGRVIRFFCDLYNLDGTPFKHDYRQKLKRNKQSVLLPIECKCPFYLFKTDENGLPSQALWDNGGYFDVSPFDKGENIRRELCLSLEEMKIPVIASYHGENAGQNVLIIRASNPIEAGDFIISFKFASQAIALRNGLYASFDLKAEQSCKNMFSLRFCPTDRILEFEASLNPYIELNKG